MSQPPPLGAQVGDAGTTFGVYADRATHCHVRFFEIHLDGPGEPAQHVVRELEMPATGAGHFLLDVPGVGHGTLYKFVLDGAELPDPYARYLPYGVHGPAMAVKSRYLRRYAPPVRAPTDRVIYELHVGCFTAEGTYAAAEERLAELARLGVTTLELMPLSAFPGTRGWGYDGVAHYAPFAPYGAPDELRHFIDEAHGAGLTVWLDVVYNHFGPSGNYLGAYSKNYLTSDVETPWGEAPRFEHPAMRRYVLDNVRYWLADFGFDGLRLDAIHTIVDPTQTGIVAEIARVAHALEPSRIVVAEDERNDPRCCTEFGCDAVWADDFHHQMRASLTGEQEGYYAAFSPGTRDLARIIERGWLYEGQVYAPHRRPRGKPADALPLSAFVYCIQNHDQIGNRALGHRLNHDVPPDEYCLATTLLLFLPMTPLLFMGQEWAASSPFLFFTDHQADLGQLVSDGRRAEFAAFSMFSDPAQRARIPDPQARETFERSKLDWSERTELGHGRALELYRALLRLRRTDVVLRHAASRDDMRSEAAGDLLAVARRGSRQARVLVVNFGSTTARVDALSLASGVERRMFGTRASPTPDPLVVAPRSATIFNTAWPSGDARHANA